MQLKLLFYARLDEGQGTTIKNSAINGGVHTSANVKWTSNIDKQFDGRDTCKSNMDCSKYSMPVNVNAPQTKSYVAFKTGQKATVDLGVPVYGISLWIYLKQSLTAELKFLKVGTIEFAIAQDLKVKIDGQLTSSSSVKVN